MGLAAANGGNASQHGGSGHNQTIDDHVKVLQQTDGAGQDHQKYVFVLINSHFLSKN
ncbi:hypothetical protein IVU49_07865 [Salmonella enterica subsp. enterica serovar Worthington]|nr:hypothetical protein [Salmonella enterica subsp. enterica serovar Worthington]